MDTEFAIDELYAAGWWPGDADTCERGPDGRWYPDDAATRHAFAAHGWTVRYHTGRAARSVRAEWVAPDGSHGAAIAHDARTARIMAYTALIRHGKSPQPGPVDPASC